MRRALLLILLCIPTFFLFLGSAAITDSDEAYYAEASREMIESGDWITPRFNYELRFEKPILFYWMIAATYAVAGVSEGAARFWAAMSGVGLVLLAYLCGRRWIDDDAGFLAGAITGTSFAAAAMARQSLPDLPLAFFITLAVWTAFEAFTGTSRARRWLLVSAAACALAVLTKGPVGVALPVLVVGAALVLEYAGAAERRRPLPVGARDLMLAVLVFILIAVPWYAAVTSVHGAGYLHRFFVAENLDRFATARYNDPRPIWFYIPILVGGLLPWSLFSLLWLRWPAKGFAASIRSSRESVRLALWALAPLAIFSISVGKQPRYILPCLVPLAVLLGSTISTRVRATVVSGRDLPLTIAGLVSGAVLMAAGVLLYRAAPLVSAAGGRGTTLWATMVVISALAVSFAAVQRSARLLPGALAVAAAITVLAVHASILAMPGHEPVVVAAQAIVTNQAPGTTACGCGAFLRNLPFYVRARTVPAGTQEEVDAVLRQPDVTLAAIDVRKLSESEAAANRRFERLIEMPYLNAALLRLDDFIRPDPDHALQRIAVIKTR